MLQGGPGLDDALLGDVPRVAQRLWTSDERLCGEGVPPALAREFCALLNAALRDDDAEWLAAARPLIWAINRLCVVRGARPEGALRFPPAHCSFRGGGLPDALRGFFAPGVKYRVPGFLATSFDREARPAPSPRPPPAPAPLPGPCAPPCSRARFDRSAGFVGRAGFDLRAEFDCRAGFDRCARFDRRAGFDRRLARQWAGA